MEDKNVKSVLSECGFSFKKQFGQNFITDDALLDSIVEGSGAEGSFVVEIGCGAGTLTRALARRAQFVRSYEIDKSLRPVLSRTLAGVENAEVIFADFLKLRLDEIEKDLPPYRVVANLPYYITTPLIMMIAEHSQKCLSMTVMVQEEVADRLCATAGTPEYGAITASVALCATCRKVMRVGREKFFPSPNVDSAVVRIDFERGRLSVADEDMYKRTVRAAFSSRRKTLENNLCKEFSLSREQVRDVFSACNIDAMTRGEKLSPEQFAVLSVAIAKIIK